jgi:hypothetical protein
VIEVEFHDAGERRVAWDDWHASAAERGAHICL